MVDIKWSNDALLDVDAISEYISQDSTENAKKLFQEIFKKVENLSTFPFMGRTVPDQSNEKIHEILHKNYRIVYEIKDDFVEVFKVVLN